MYVNQVAYENSVNQLIRTRNLQKIMVDAGFEPTRFLQTTVIHHTTLRTAP